MIKSQRIILLLIFGIMFVNALNNPINAQVRRMTARKRAAQENVILASKLISTKNYDQAYEILNDVTGNLDRKNALAYYYLAVICTESEKYRDSTKAKSFISEAENNGLDYSGLGLKPIQGLSSVKMEVANEQNVIPDTLKQPVPPIQSRVLTEKQQTASVDTTIRIKEPETAQASIPGKETPSAQVDTAKEKSVQSVTTDMVKKKIPAAAVDNAPQPPQREKVTVPPIETAQSSIPVQELPPTQIDTANEKSDQSVATNIVKRETPATEVERAPQLPQREKVTIPQIEVEKESLPELPATSDVITTKPVEETVKEVIPDSRTPEVQATPETPGHQASVTPESPTALPTQLVRWGMDLSTKDFIYDVRSEMGRINTKEYLGQELTYNEKSTLLNLRAELNEARREMLQERYQKAKEILLTALKRDSFWWETNYLLSMVLNRDPDQGGDRRLAVIHGQQAKQYLKTPFPTSLDPCPDKLLSPRQMFSQYLSRSNQFYDQQQFLLAENQLNYALGIQADVNFPEAENLNDDDLAAVQFMWGQVAIQLRDYNFAIQRFLDAKTIHSAYQDTVDNYIQPYIEKMINSQPEISPTDVQVKAPDQPPVRSDNSANLAFMFEGLPDLPIEVSEPQDPRVGIARMSVGQHYTVYGPVTYKADMDVKQHKLKLILGIAAVSAVLIGISSF